MAFMDLHHGHVDLIKEIQTVLTKRATLWDYEPALVYLYTGDGQSKQKLTYFGTETLHLGPIYTGDWEPSTAVCFFVNFVMASQSGDNPLEDLAKFGYNLNMKLHF